MIFYTEFPAPHRHTGNCGAMVIDRFTGWRRNCNGMHQAGSRYCWHHRNYELELLTVGTIVKDSTGEEFVYEGEKKWVRISNGSAAHVNSFEHPVLVLKRMRENT